MLRSLSNKLLLAVVTAVALPFAAFALFLDHEITNRLALEFARQTLRGIAADLASGVDAEFRRRLEDVESWSREPIAAWVLRESHDRRLGREAPVRPDEIAELTGGADSFRGVYEGVLDSHLAVERDYDLFALFDARGEPIVVSTREGSRSDDEVRASIAASAPTDAAWFTEALAGGVGRIAHHRSHWLGDDDDAIAPVDRRYHVGIAVGVRSRDDPDVRGVLLALVDWRVFESLIETPLVKEAFRGLVSEGVTPSPYAWIWDSDADTILAHQDRTLTYERVSGPRIGLPQMVEDARAAPNGLYRPYTFNGVRKNAAFARTAQGPRSGFGWVVGVGIDNVDIERATQGVSRVLERGTLFVLLVVGVWAVFIARRTVAPIRELERHTRRVAEGDLGARVHIETGDEVAELARAFNRMTADLAVQNERIVKAEKDAAWREMARQIAHDLKNPLTPIQLSLDLYERARRENDPRQEEIAQRCLEMVKRQVAHLREIATGFHEFTGGAKPAPTRFDLGELAQELVDVHRELATEKGVAIVEAFEPCTVYADRAKIRRAATNLLANALEATERGGALEVSCSAHGGFARFEVLDDGPGLSPEIEAHLFEPYFTTKSGGTGLGLAIARRVVDEAGGRISIGARADRGSDGRRRGCRAVLELPLADAAPGASAAEAGGSA
ncbi:MAG: ATP-binding protein [Planctomycetota bacterium]